MSKIRCVCGHVIRDQTNALPYKAAALLDVDQEELMDWVVTELRTYVDAVASRKVDEWLSVRGCRHEYLDLKLNHGEILFDQVLSRFGGFEKSIYECESCGRLLVEGADNQFLTYSPDSKHVNHVLSMSRHKPSTTD
jgi:hypothetical protein